MEQFIDPLTIVTKNFELLEVGDEVVEFEGGYRMTRKDYDFINAPEIIERQGKRVLEKRKLGFDVNKGNKRITHHFLP